MSFLAPRALRPRGCDRVPQVGRTASVFCLGRKNLPGRRDVGAGCRQPGPD
ncbi:hypothetical protein Rumeso_03410 [Rubellimicrobium mesophilum DSM 19309]|uniref:Uncharacterized protein n=1 Tax=Rubellimicrobium mesophilum DSM 19309 TaxID=442562 RepID=A0A017HKU0_9RHOB|nr:hypothetical protein Rumeso_03410 [Rubellimicrobium mesophilum DSM 19309]